MTFIGRGGSNPLARTYFQALAGQPDDGGCVFVLTLKKPFPDDEKGWRTETHKEFPTFAFMIYLPFLANT